MLRREKRLTNLSLTVVDLFCGAGGLSLGFQKAGFDLLLAADNDAKAIQTYRKNIGNHAYVEDSPKA
jgi:DNA (cytosine-5)-methyltransferase 1